MVSQNKQCPNTSSEYGTFWIQNFKPLAIFSDCTARFVSELVGHPEDRFSHNEAHMICGFESRIGNSFYTSLNNNYKEGWGSATMK